MGKGYPVELRERVVSAFKREVGTREEIAAIFEVGVATVGRWLSADRKRGSVEPLPHGGGQPRALTDEEATVLLGIVEAKPDGTIEEYRLSLKAETGKEVSTSTISRELARAGLTRKKKTSEPRNR